MAHHPTPTGTVAFIPLANQRTVVGLHVLLCLHALLQLLDLASTYIALGAGGVEANPISRGIIEGGGWYAYGGVKVAMGALFLALWPVSRTLHPAEARLVFAAMLGFAVFMTAVVVNNALIAAWPNGGA